MRTKRLIQIAVVVVVVLTAASWGLVAELAGQENAKQQKCSGPMDKIADLALDWIDDANQLCPAVEGAQLAPERMGRAAGKVRSLAIRAPRRRGAEVNLSFGEAPELGREDLSKSRYWNENVLNRLEVNATRLHGGGENGQTVKAIGLLILLPPAFSGLVLVSRIFFRG